MAEADTNTRGFCRRLASASTSTRVVSMRLLRRSAFRAGVQRPCAMLAPLKCTTASMPSIAATSTVAAIGSQTISPVDAALPGRTNRVTLCPCARSALTSAVPVTPDAPEIRIFIVSRAKIVHPQRLENTSAPGRGLAKKCLTRAALFLYLTYRLNTATHVFRSTHSDFFRTRRSHTARDSREALLGRSLGDRVG